MPTKINNPAFFLLCILVVILLFTLQADELFADARFIPVNGGRVVARDGPGTGFPSVVRIPDWVPANQRPAPNARYYMYYGTHKGRYIMMKWAESIEGQWTTFDLAGRHNGLERRGVFDVDADVTRQEFDHVAHPDVFIDQDRQQFVMLYHGQNQPDILTINGVLISQTHNEFIATSAFGLNFNDPDSAGGEPGFGPLVWRVHDITRDMWIKGSYHRTFYFRGNMYSVSKKAILNKATNTFDAMPDNPLTTRAAWVRQSVPYDLYSNERVTGQKKIYSPACSFTASSRFAAHPNNPNPGVRIPCSKSPSGERINHVGILLLKRQSLLQVFFYVKADPGDRYSGLYRLTYDIHDENFHNWSLATDSEGQVLFVEYLTPQSIRDAIPDNGLKHAVDYADPVSLGTSEVFVDEDGAHYLFYSYVSEELGGDEGEGQISILRIFPDCSNGIDDDGDGMIDFPADPSCLSAEGASE